MWYAILPRILSMSLTAGIFVLAVLLARLLLRRAPRAFSYALWLVVLFRLLCPVSFSAPWSVLTASLSAGPFRAGASIGSGKVTPYDRTASFPPAVVI